MFTIIGRPIIIFAFIATLWNFEIYGIWTTANFILGKMAFENLNFRNLNISSKLRLNFFNPQTNKIIFSVGLPHCLPFGYFLSGCGFGIRAGNKSCNFCNFCKKISSRTKKSTNKTLPKIDRNRPNDILQKLEKCRKFRFYRRS